MRTPLICFGQQPCGFFPRRFLIAKIQTARRLQEEIGGRIVFFYHDSDHDPRETVTIVRDRNSGVEHRLNFAVVNRIQKQFAPLYRKQISPGWTEKTARQLGAFAPRGAVECFAGIAARTVADFCLEMYVRLGLLDRIEVVRSSDPAVRKRAAPIDDYFVDVRYKGEPVRARFAGDRLRLHKGGDAYIDLPMEPHEGTQISPTRDTRLRWMQSVIGCTQYVCGAGELRYLRREDAPGVQFIPRDHIDEADRAWIPDA